MSRRSPWLAAVLTIAVAACNGIAGRDPKSVRDPMIDRYLQRATTLASQARLSEAIEEAEKAVRTGPDDFDALLALGALRRAAGVAASAGRDDTQGWYRRAREVLERAIVLRSDAEQPRIELAQLLADSQQVAAAVSLLEPLAETGTPSARFHLASLLAIQGDHGRAVAIYRAGLLEAPDDIAAHVACGQSLVQLGELTAGKEEFARAVVLAPTQPEAFVQLGLALGRLDEHDWSVVALARAADLDPTLEKAQYSLAMAQRRLGRSRAAAIPQHRFDRLREDFARVTELSEALAKTPADHELRSELAEIYLQRGKPLRARATAEIALAREPRNDRAHRVLAGVHRLNRLPAQALVEINLALDINPDDVASLEQRAALHFEAGRLTEAQTDLQRILAREHISGPTLEMMARIALLANRPEEAIEIAQRGVGRNPPLRHAPLFMVIGEALVRLNRPDQASQVLLTYLESQPADPAAIRLLIDLSKAANDPARTAAFEERLRFILTGELPASGS